MDPRPFPDLHTASAATASARWRGLWGLPLLLIGGMAAGAALGRMARAQGSEWGALLKQSLSVDLWTLACLPLLWLLSVLVHEFGHLTGGRLGGMRPLLLYAGPIHLEFGAGVRLRWNRVAATWGGLAACAPAAGTGRGAYALLVAGGPLASFALALAAWTLAFQLGGWLGGLSFLTAMVSLMIGLATLIPLSLGGYQSDGGQLLGLLRNAPDTQQRLALGSLMAQSYAGLRPRHWDPGVLQQLAAAESPMLRLFGPTLLAAHAEDQGRLDAADAHWREVATQLGSPSLTSVPQALRAALAMGLATWIGHRRREPASARRWLDAARGAFPDAAMEAQARAAVALAEGDIATARAQLQAGRAALPRVMDLGTRAMLTDTFADMDRAMGTGEAGG